MGTRIVFPAADAVALEEHDPGQPGPGQVRVRSRWTLISAGTELMLLHRRCEPGTHWHQWLAGGQPVHPGYCCAGIVETVGAGVTALRPDDAVAVRCGHASHHLVPAEECHPVPAGVDLRDVPWWSIAKIAAQSARDAALRLGDSVLIVGLGPIGQLAVRWAVAAGCERVIACDPEPLRLDLARAGGATAVIAQPLDACLADRDVGYGLRGRVWADGAAPRVVIDCTGSAAVFALALAAVAEHGTVVILGDTGTPSRQALTADLLLKGVRVVGSHDKHVDAAWNHASVCRLFLGLLQRGRISVAGLATHVFHPHQAAEAYAACAQRERTLGVLFDWSG